MRFIREHIEPIIATGILFAAFYIMLCYAFCNLSH